MYCHCLSFVAGTSAKINVEWMKSKSNNTHKWVFNYRSSSQIEQVTREAYGEHWSEIHSKLVKFTWLHTLIDHLTKENVFPSRIKESGLLPISPSHFTDWSTFDGFSWGYREFSVVLKKQCTEHNNKDMSPGLLCQPLFTLNAVVVHLKFQVISQLGT